MNLLDPNPRVSVNKRPLAPPIIRGPDTSLDLPAERVEQNDPDAAYITTWANAQGTVVASLDQNGQMTLAGGLGGGGGVDTNVGVWNCASGLAVGDPVTCDASNHVVATPPGSAALGVVEAKPTAKTARVRYAGELPGLSGLTPGATYYLAAAGGALSAAPPDPADVANDGRVHQSLGVARNATTLVVRVGDPTVL